MAKMTCNPAAAEYSSRNEPKNRQTQLQASTHPQVQKKTVHKKLGFRVCEGNDHHTAAAALLHIKTHHHYYPCCFSAKAKGIEA
jgi:hypothetical protein